MKKSKDIISQENKFLRLCGGKYKDKIKKRIPMTTGEFQKFMYLFETMGFNEYSLYFSMELFPELLVDYGERCRDDGEIDYGQVDFPIEEIVTISDAWLKEFCDQMPLESQRNTGKSLKLMKSKNELGSVMYSVTDLSSLYMGIIINHVPFVGVQ